MNANRVINDLLAAHKLAWRDVWKVTLDLVAGEVIVVLKDGRKYTASLARREEKNGSRMNAELRG